MKNTRSKAILESSGKAQEAETKTKTLKKKSKVVDDVQASYEASAGSKEKTKKITSSNFDDKAKKTWSKVIIDHYFKKLKKDDQYQRLLERYNINDSTIKSLIYDLKIKQKELAIHVKKQWMILKKFNLQEKIYREESKLLQDNEKSKESQIVNEALHKLADMRVPGFEDTELLKSRTMDKMTKTYEIDEDVLKELNCVFFDPKYAEQEANLINERKEVQYTSILKLSKNVPEPEYDLDNYYNNIQYKNELKRFERELETKAVQKISNFSEEYALSNPNKELIENTIKYDEMFQGGGSLDRIPSNFSNLDYLHRGEGLSQNFNFSKSSSIQSNLNLNLGNLASPLQETLNLPITSVSKKFNIDGDDSADKQNVTLSPGGNLYKGVSGLNYFDETEDKQYKNDFIIGKLLYIQEDKVNELKKSLYTSLTQSQQPPIKDPYYKSPIIDDIYNKLMKKGCMAPTSALDMQNLIYISHMVVKDLVHAKLNNLNYAGSMNPDELIDLLKKIKNRSSGWKQ